MIDNCAPLPVGVIRRDSFPNLGKLSARVVVELVVKRRRRAELLLNHPARRIISVCSGYRGVSALRAITEIAFESRVLRVEISQPASGVIVVTNRVIRRKGLAANRARNVVERAALIVDAAGSLNLQDVAAN